MTASSVMIARSLLTIDQDVVPVQLMAPGGVVRLQKGVVLGAEDTGGVVGSIANEAINSGNLPQTKLDMGKKWKLLQQFQISQSLTAAQKRELSDIRRTDLVQHQISTEGNAPVRQHSRRLPQSLTKVVDVQIQDKLENQIISPSTTVCSL